jgi:hypothetical protein
MKGKYIMYSMKLRITPDLMDSLVSESASMLVIFSPVSVERLSFSSPS